jgi:hypothetical protein
MKALRFSTSALMLLVLIAGVSLAALRTNTPSTPSLLMLVALVLLSGSVLVAAARRGRVRRVALGFALFGWPQMILGFASLTSPDLSLPRASAFLEELIPYLNPKVLEEMNKYNAVPVRWDELGYSEYRGNNTVLFRYRYSSHFLTTLFLATLGAGLGSQLASEADELEPPPPPPG